MRKPNVQSPLDQLADEQQHELWVLLKTTKYEDAVDEARTRYGVRSSVSALQRFFKRRGLQESLRDSLAAQTAFENSADVKTLEKHTRAAVVAAMWEAITTKDVGSIVRLGKLLVSIDSGARDAQSLALSRAKFEASEKRLSAVQNAVDAAKNGAIDPAKVADEIDRILGRRK